MTSNDVVKICDLGISKISANHLDMTSFLPTLAYISPELYECLSTNCPYSFKTDVW